MREAILIGDPLLVDVGIVPRQASHDDAASMIDPDRRTAGVMLGNGRRGNQIEGS